MNENRAKYSRCKVVDNSKVLQYIALMQHKLCTRSRHRKHVTAKSFTSLRTPLFYWNGPFRRKARETAQASEWKIPQFHNGVQAKSTKALEQMGLQFKRAGHNCCNKKVEITQPPMCTH